MGVKLSILPGMMTTQQQRVRAARTSSGLVIVSAVVLMFQHQSGCESDVRMNE